MSLLFTGFTFLTVVFPYRPHATHKLLGPIPTEIGNCAHLGKSLWLFSHEAHTFIERLELQDNRLTGTIPEEMGQLEKLGKSYTRLYKC